MAPPLDRTWFNTLIDDDGSGTTGTIWNKTQIDGLLDSIDVSLAPLVDTPTLNAKNYVDKSGTPAAQQLAVFDDADTVRGEPFATISPPNRLLLTQSYPSLALIHTPGAVDQKRWKIVSDGVSMQVATQTDAGVDVAQIISLQRTGELRATAIILTGTNIASSTFDGADNSYIQVAGGGPGGSSRGARALICGNEFTGAPGCIFAEPGDATNARFAVRKANSQELFKVDAASGLVDLLSGQMRFPSTQIPSADPYTQDDYREVNWTPTLGGSGGASGQVYTQQSGRATKIGRLVHLEFSVIMSNKGTINGQVRLQGFPFPAHGGFAYSSVCMPRVGGLATNWYSLNCQILSGQTYADLFGVNAASTSNLAVVSGVDLSNTFEMRGGFIYSTD